MHFSSLRAVLLGATVNFIAYLGFSSALLAADWADMPTPLIHSALVAQSAQPAAQTGTTLAIALRPQPEWHGYWQQPGEVGLAPQLTWHLPAGVSVGEVAYPLPETLSVDGVMNHVYGKPYALLTELSVDRHLPVGTQLPIRLAMRYLVCRHDACVPETADLETTLIVGDGAPDRRYAQDFIAWRQALPKPLSMPATFTLTDDQIRIQLPLPASVPIDNAHLFSATPQALKDSYPQQFSRQGDQLIITTQRGAQLGTQFEATLALGQGLGLTFTAKQGTAEGALGGTLLLALAGALLGGLLLNLMPCVFPILSLKALSLARAGGSLSAARREACAYTLGVVAMCMTLGATLLVLRAGGSQIGWAFQLQNPQLLLLLLLLSCAMAFNLTGLFEFSAVNAGAKLAHRGGVLGAFWTGVLAAFVATPCTGPFMAAALGSALVLPPLAGLLVFAGLGLGMALPFLLLGFMPALQRKMPKPGAWMATLRHVLAVPMFLTVLALFWVLAQQVTANALIAILGCSMLFAFGLWWMGLRQRSFNAYAWLPALLAFVIAMALGMTQLEPKAKQAAAQAASPFSTATLAAWQQSKQPIFLYFTADWCMTCKVNEQVAIRREATQQAFAQAGVKVMRGDWTHGAAEITAFLATQGRSGVPLYMWYSPKQAQPQILPQLLTPRLLIEQAQLEQAAR
ncbi:MAG: protein-disulfide reductase DsbD family protein [Aeromonas sp.]